MCRTKIYFYNNSSGVLKWPSGTRLESRLHESARVEITNPGSVIHLWNFTNHESKMESFIKKVLAKCPDQLDGGFVRVTQAIAEFCILGSKQANAKWEAFKRKHTIQ